MTLCDAPSGFFDVIRVCTDQLVTHIGAALANQISFRRGFQSDYSVHDRLLHDRLITATVTLSLSQAPGRRPSLDLRRQWANGSQPFNGDPGSGFAYSNQARTVNPPFYASERTHSFYPRIEALHQTRYSPTCTCLQS